MMINNDDDNDDAGSGFKSKHAYRNGYFSTRIKLPAGYTAGTNTAFYVSCSRARSLTETCF